MLVMNKLQGITYLVDIAEHFGLRQFAFLVQQGFKGTSRDIFHRNIGRMVFLKDL